MAAGLFTIDYPDGNRIAVRYSDLADLIPDEAERAAWQARFDEWLDETAAALQMTREDVAWHLGAYVAEIAHEEAVYARVCERKGLLAL